MHEDRQRLDPETAYVEIYRDLSQHEFWWDMVQSLSFALFRTYAVPSIGDLLDATGEFTDRRQQRYDDTVLLLDAPLVHGFESPEGRTAVRRINQMHRAYDIGNDDMRYVLSTFVVVPKRWIDDFGRRPLTEVELRASVNYYRALGRHMAIRDVPTTYDGFADLMDSYEAEHFAFSPGSRRVADALVELATTFYPRPFARGCGSSCTRCSTSRCGRRSATTTPAASRATAPVRPCAPGPASCASSPAAPPEGGGLPPPDPQLPRRPRPRRPRHLPHPPHRPRRVPGTALRPSSRGVRHGGGVELYDVRRFPVSSRTTRAGGSRRRHGPATTTGAGPPAPRAVPPRRGTIPEPDVGPGGDLRPGPGPSASPPRSSTPATGPRRSAR
ncbi:oxygenase MpaB family protein [Nocardioides zeae]